MTRRTNYRGFVCENTNQEVRIVSDYLTRLKKTARAGKWGKDLYCPLCNKQHTVYHFNWSAILAKDVINQFKKQNGGYHLILRSSARE